MELLRLWPVLLISLGIRLIFMNTRAHLLCLLGPALVVATAAWVVFTYEGSGGGPWSGLENAQSAAIECPPAATGSPAGLDVEFAAGRLELISEGGPLQAEPKGAEAPPAPAADSASAMTGTLRHSDDDLEWSCRGGSLRLRRARGSRFGGVHFFVPVVDGGARWEARLGSVRPVTLRAELAAATADLDLRHFTLDRAEIQAAASSLTLRLGTPRGRVPIRIDGAVANVRLTAPEGACVTVSREWILNILEIEDDRGAGRHRRQFSSGECGQTGADAPRYEVRYHLPLSSVSIDRERGGA